MAPSATEDSLPPLPKRQEKTYPPARIFNVKETKFEKLVDIQSDGRQQALSSSNGNAAIVIDNGSSSVRAGWSFEAKPRINIPPIMAKYRDRKLGKTYSFAGTDCYADTTARAHIRNAFEAGSGVVANWDVMEHVLDWTFLKLGMNAADSAIDMPIVMTETVANLPYSRKCKQLEHARIDGAVGSHEC